MKRWPVIRHFRWLYHSYKFAAWWHKEGRYYGMSPNTKDVEFLNDIFEGRQ